MIKKSGWYSPLIYILTVSFALNAIFIKYDFFDYAFPVIKKKYFPSHLHFDVSDESEKIILTKSMEMLKSDKEAMQWNEMRGLSERILSVRHVRNSNAFRRYNYPRGFLFYGISEYAAINKNDELMREVVREFDRQIISDGSAGFHIDKTDQAIFGLVALNIYEYTRDKKYLNFSRDVYEFIMSQQEDGIINYRKGYDLYLNDVLGLVVPFILKYKKLMYEGREYALIEKQLDFFIRYGVDKDTYLPAHAINRHSKVKVGSANWGRGIGWYLVGLSAFHAETGAFKKEYDGIISSLNQLKTDDGLWSQFPGSSDEFDASSTLMYMVSMLAVNKEQFSRREILELLHGHIDDDGMIMGTSGDTYGANRYSSTFGPSELSQGLLMWALAMASKDDEGLSVQRSK